MTPIRTLLCALLTVAVCACASSPAVQYFSLDDGRPTRVGAADGPRVMVTQVALPDAIDRPQLLVRTAGNQLQLNDQYEWIEPLRRQIPRVIARNLGEALNSAGVLAIPVDAQDFDADFNVMLDIQRLEIVLGSAADLDVVWRVKSRDGKQFFGRCLVREPIEQSAQPDAHQAAVAAERRALQAVAASIASDISSRINGAPAPGVSTHLRCSPIRVN